MLHMNFKHSINQYDLKYLAINLSGTYYFKLNSHGDVYTSISFYEAHAWIFFIEKGQSIPPRGRRFQMSGSQEVIR